MYNTVLFPPYYWNGTINGRGVVATSSMLRQLRREKVLRRRRERETESARGRVRRDLTRLLDGVCHRGPEQADPEYDDFLPVLAIAHQGNVAREINAERGGSALLRQVLPSAAACYARVCISKGRQRGRSNVRHMSKQTSTHSQAGHGITTEAA
jgi:hypothetical protein